MLSLLFSFLLSKVNEYHRYVIGNFRNNSNGKNPTFQISYSQRLTLLLSLALCNNVQEHSYSKFCEISIFLLAMNNQNLCKRNIWSVTKKIVFQRELSSKIRFSWQHYLLILTEFVTCVIHQFLINLYISDGNHLLFNHL